ncbi:Ig-like domain-containing protein, partial [Desulfovibrio sp.]|uniref:Ig-like domain-containing protein n=1 Tax=Desulfovibrio sp. TaxID=885 RepID=UPI003D144E80
KSFTITTKDADGKDVSANYPVGSGTVTIAGAHGTLTVNAGGSYSYKANPNTEGQDSFTFKITDADGDSTEQTIDVTVNKASGPVIGDTNGSLTVDEKGLTSTSDDSETSTWSAPKGYTITDVVTPVGTFGTASIVDGKLSYTLSDAIGHKGENGVTWAGADTVIVTLKDDFGNTFDVAVKVNVVDDVPTIDGMNLNPLVDANDAITGNLEGFHLGADVVGSKVEVTIDQKYSNGTGEHSSTTTITGTVDAEGNITWSKPGFTLDSNGSFTYTRPEHDAQDGNKDTYTITVKVTDGDGDSVRTCATVCSTVTNEVKVGTSGSDNLSGTEHNDLIIGDTQGDPIVVQGHDYNIAFIVDTSGSMSGQMDAAKKSLTAVFNELAKSANEPNSGTVNILLVGFSTGITQNVSVNLNDPGALDKLLKAVGTMTADGGTNYELGLKTAANWFTTQDHTIETKTYFITDGKPTYYQADSNAKLVDYYDWWVNDTSAKNIDLTSYTPGKEFISMLSG